MSVIDELSIDVAVASLEREGSGNTGGLKEVLDLFRSTLRELSSEENLGRRTTFIPERPDNLKRSAARGAN